jgi:hypothetical protein
MTPFTFYLFSITPFKKKSQAVQFKKFILKFITPFRQSAPMFLANVAAKREAMSENIIIKFE